MVMAQHKAMVTQNQEKNLVKSQPSHPVLVMQHQKKKMADRERKELPRRLPLKKRIHVKNSCVRMEEVVRLILMELLTVSVNMDSPV